MTQPAQPVGSRPARVPALDVDALSVEQRAVYDAIAAGPRGSVRGPLAVWLHNPALAERAQELGAYCRYGTSLPPRLSELAILVTAAHWRARYEWYVHAPIALRAGLAEPCVEAIRTGRQPEFVNADETLVHRFAAELLASRAISNETWDRATAILGMQSVVDLVGVLGYYGLISMTINAFEIPLPDGSQDPFPHGDLG